MKDIIQQIATELVLHITKKAFGKELSDLDALAANVFEDCAEASRQILQAVISVRNRQLREDKAFRKKEGLIIKEKDRSRQILTKLGMIEWKRDYYYDKTRERYVFPLDYMLGVRSYERIGDEVSAQLLNRAAEVSYARSSDIVTGGTVSRQSVRNHLIQADIPQKEPTSEHKPVSELHLYADEDHVHMQKTGKKKGKENRIVPLITVTEGTVPVDRRRNQTLRPMHFVDEEQSSKRLWKTVEGYIEKAYDMERINKIYIHADGGNWIKNGLETFAQTIYVMDGYHFFKELKKVSKRFPTRNVRTVITNALKNDDRKRAGSFLKEISVEDDGVSDFRDYLFGHWKEIRNRIVLDIPGSCTEGQVSHVLSERFSRNPMGWSKIGLGKMSVLRVYRCNGGKLTGADRKPKETQESYREYADRFMNEQIQGTLDWSIFEPEIPVMDGNSGTQVLMRYYGTNRGLIN